MPSCVDIIAKPKSVQQVLQDEKITASNDPLYLVESGYLSIKTKKGDLIKLILNSAQTLFHEKIMELRAKQKPIRIWLLKFRQGGMSTYIEALIYALTSQLPNRNALIMADEKEHSSNLFEMSKLYQEQLEKDEPHLAPELKKSNEKKLEWDKIHSQVIIATAENTEAARSHTYQVVHLSEIAFFRDLKTVMDGLNQSVPDHGDTIIIGETTANGMNLFYYEWVRAIEGKTDWIPIFLPWFLMEEYSKPLENGELYSIYGVNFDSDTTETDFLAEESQIEKEFELTKEQLNWRRWAIVNKCSGSLITFRTEYPITWEEAFAMTGDMYFDRRGLDYQRNRLCRPLKIGEIFEQDMKWEFRTLKEGRIELYEEPSKGEQYIVTADGSEGLGVDEAGIVVLNKRTNKTVAIVAGQYTPEEIAHMSIALGNYFNIALIAPENKGYGYMICQLINKKYGNIYKRLITKTGEDKETEELGFNTNSVTRPQYLAQLNEEIRNNTTELKSKKLINECQTFINKKDKDGRVVKVEAQSGCQDGLVICRAIAGIVRQQHPYVVKTDNKLRKRLYHQKTKQVNAGFGFK